MKAEFAVNQTRLGDRYWRISDGATGRHLSPPIWSGEIEWFVDSLEAVASDLDVRAFPEGGGPYPLAFRVNGVHAVVLLLADTGKEPLLQIERWKGSWTEKGTEAFRVRRYFGPENRSSFGRVPLAEGWTEQFTKLALNFRSGVLAERDRCWSNLRAHLPELPVDLPSPEFVVVEVERNNSVRRSPWEPQFDRLKGAVLLPKALVPLLLDACRGGRDLDQISGNIDRVLSPEAIGQLLNWSMRYADATLRAGYFFRLDFEGKRQLYSATQDLPAFGADPLLTGLLNSISNSPVRLKPGEPGPSPQYPKGLPVDLLRERGLIEDLVSTALGVFPRPSAQRTSATLRVAKVTAFMNRQRWWILQMLDLATAVLANLPSRSVSQTVLALQRIALMSADCAAAFSDYKDEDQAVTALLTEARERRAATIFGKRRVARVRRKADLPERG